MKLLSCLLPISGKCTGVLGNLAIGINRVSVTIVVSVSDTHTHACTRACMCARIHAYTNTHTNTLMQTHVCTHITYNTLMHVHTLCRNTFLPNFTSFVRLECITVWLLVHYRLWSLQGYDFGAFFWMRTHTIPRRLGGELAWETIPEAAVIVPVKLSHIFESDVDTNGRSGGTTSETAS